MSDNHQHRCVMCLRIDELPDPPKPDAKYICEWCFRRVRKEFEKQNPGQSLRAKEDDVK